jgi:hypothetical protein
MESLKEQNPFCDAAIEESTCRSTKKTENYNSYLVLQKLVCGTPLWLKEAYTVQPWWRQWQ